MWALELVFEVLAQWCLHHAPKPIRVGCTVLLIALVIGLLGLALWAFST
jgi:hypothetical protein